MKLPPNKTVIIIAGPTAVGKTAVAIDIAKYFRTEIISADSRQCYKELNIGVARPSPDELQQVPHHFIASHSIHDEVTAIVFEQYALKKTKELFQEHDTIVMTGGTGLYIKAFCDGLDSIPQVPLQVRSGISKKYKEGGLEWLQNEIKTKDPEFYQSGEIQNPRRLMRALEVVEATGESVLHFRGGEKAIRDFTIKKIGLELSREELNRRIDKRVDEMLAKGLLDEVKSLLPYKHLTALQTVGYAEMFDFLEGKTALAKAAEEIKTHTRQYAKRQLTWFRKDKGFEWMHPSDISVIYDFLQGKT
ncbi:MAG: tRNA (adenosine(37)-N6)-dimethylallyltransferase MiaA [Chitinophagaceae bacterium]